MVTIEKLVYGGDGLSRGEGQVTLTPFVLPGEQVEIEPGESRSGVLRAGLRSVVEASADRVPALCPYYGKCGGCQYQHATYDAQLRAKRAILEETLQRVGRVTPPSEIALISAEPWGYRNRAQFHIEQRKLGYRMRGSHKLIAIEQCPISSPKVNECIVALNRMLRDARWPKFISQIEVFTDETQVQINVLEAGQVVAKRFFEWAAEEIPGFVPGVLEYGGFRVSPNSFFQVNRFLVERMAEAVVGGTAGEHALDLYSGVGLFSLPLARQFAKVTAVESGSGAVRDMEFNAARAGVKVHAVGAIVDEYLRTMEARPDFVLADPPRTGLGKTVVNKLVEWKPERITVVSCDPSTFARDLAGLMAGGYQVEELTLIDLFPQTFHIETICKLRLG
jgi:23S rRNA (uracil1939-C5)-methyltransferase